MMYWFWVNLNGAEANVFFDALSTGHMGLATVHANSADMVVDRLVTLIKKDIKAQYYTEEFLKKNISESVDSIIFMENFKIKTISKILSNGECKCQFEMDDKVSK